MEPSSLRSVYTTVEGLLVKLIDQLKINNPFGQGDSANDKKFMAFIGQLEEYKDGKKYPWTLVLDDPADNCFVYNPKAPEDDPKITVEIYERSAEQNDDLGLTHMKTDNYQEPEKKAEEKAEEKADKKAE